MQRTLPAIIEAVNSSPHTDQVEAGILKTRSREAVEGGVLAWATRGTRVGPSLHQFRGQTLVFPFVSGTQF